MISLKVANDILDMQNELLYLRKENARLQQVEREFTAYVRDSIRHGEQQMVGWLDAILSGKLKAEA